MVAVWDAAGTPLALNDDDGKAFDSRLTFTFPRNGNYFVSVAGYPFALPNDPFDSGSGDGVGTEGAYRSSSGSTRRHRLLRLDLRAGDLVGASVAGAASELASSGPSAASGSV